MGLRTTWPPRPHKPPTPAEAKQLQDLSRAGKRLMGFCRTNLFKRLESSGEAFQQSIERHILRNYIFLHAIEHFLPLPLGTQDAGLLDAAQLRRGRGRRGSDGRTLRGRQRRRVTPAPQGVALRGIEEFRRSGRRSSTRLYASQFKRRFKWLRPDLFVKSLADDLADRRGKPPRCPASAAASGIHARTPSSMHSAISSTKRHPSEKVIVFTQFADTVRYLEAQLSSARRQAHRRRHWATTTIRRASPGASVRKATRSVTACSPTRSCGPGRHRRPQRGAEPPGRRHHRQLRSALGHHPAGPAGGARGPHRPEVGEDPLLFVSAG